MQVLGETLLSCAVPSKSARGAVFAPLILSIAGPATTTPPPAPAAAADASDASNGAVPAPAAAVDPQASLGRFLTLSQYQSSSASSALVRSPGLSHARVRCLG